MGYEGVREVICSKWALEILAVLADGGPQNFTDLESTLDASSDTLTKRLRFLESTGFVERQEFSSKNVAYTITDEGQAFITDLQKLESTYEL
ncbi:hypothetical protein GCM10028857_03140 [Salinarchaeum chitinilyticum]